MSVRAYTHLVDASCLCFAGLKLQKIIIYDLETAMHKPATLFGNSRMMTRVTQNPLNVSNIVDFNIICQNDSCVNPNTYISNPVECEPLSFS